MSVFKVGLCMENLLRPDILLNIFIIPHILVAFYLDIKS